MKAGKGKGTRLRLIRGGLDPDFMVGSVRIVMGSLGHPPFKVDAVAVEEDTYMVLSAPPRVVDPVEHPIRTLTGAFFADPAVPGGIVVREGNPLKLLAIVHDLNLNPSWREEWVTGALREVLHEVERRGLRSLALPALGAGHGSMKVERFAALLKSALETEAPGGLRRIWLICGEGSRPIVARVFQLESG